MRVIKSLLICLFAFTVQTGISKTSIAKSTEVNDSVKFMEVTTTQAGELSALLDTAANSIDSLVVNGPINSTDFQTMWKASFEGKLSIINLAKADVANRAIPDNAFWHQFQQLDEGSGTIRIIKLKRIILPNNIKTIGSNAFFWAPRLETINIPDSLESFGESAFYHCNHLNVDSLVIPEGVEEIPDYCFSDCYSLSSKVVLPSTLKTIGFAAFYVSPITGIYLPEGLDSIGDGAFAGSRFKEITIPSTCKKFGINIFGGGSIVSTLRFAEGTTYIPYGVANKCSFLQKVYFPSTTEEIAARAFEGLDNVDSLTLPASLTKIGSRAFADMTGLKYIKSEALTPPVCDGAGQTNAEYFWGQISNDLPVFVPRGTKEQYEATLGWNYFTNIKEYDTDPTGISAITDNAEGSQPYSIYSVNGELVAKGMANGNIYNVSLPHGIYVVKQGGKTFKKAF